MSHRSGRMQAIRLVAAVVFMFSQLFGHAAVSQDDYEIFVNKYAEIHMQFTTDDMREAPLVELLNDVESYLEKNVSSADAWIALARVKFGYANTQGPIAGRRRLREVKENLETAIELDATGQNGYPQAFLGYLYAGVPSWPLSFGNAKTSRLYLDQALEIDSDSVENNYLKAVVLVADEDFETARRHIEIAESKLDSMTELSPAWQYRRENLVSLKNRLPKL